MNRVILSADEIEMGDSVFRVGFQAQPGGLAPQKTLGFYAQAALSPGDRLGREHFMSRARDEGL